MLVKLSDIGNRRNSHLLELAKLNACSMEFCVLRDRNRSLLFNFREFSETVSLDIVGLLFKVCKESLYSECSKADINLLGLAAGRQTVAKLVVK